jgi:hypothetical protein
MRSGRVDTDMVRGPSGLIVRCGPAGVCQRGHIARGIG